MKTKTKRLTVIIALLLICVAILSCMSGCTKKDSNRFNTDLFQCMYNEDKTGVIILELTKKGQEQEILVIPEEINGLPVIQLGGETKGYPYNVPHYLKSEKLKKLYVCSTDYITSKEEFPNLSEVFIVNEKAFASLALRPGDTTLNNFTGEIEVFATENVLTKYQDQIKTENNRRRYKRANIIYYRQIEGNMEAYWIDDTSSNYQKILPVSIESIFKDPAFTEKWDEKYEDMSENFIKLYVE